MEEERGTVADDFVVDDAITDLERKFPLKDLLTLEYFQKYRHAHYRQREIGAQIHTRNYYNLLKFIAEIHEYRSDDAKTLAKALRTGPTDWRNCEATFAEIIVYRYYVRLAYEGIVTAVRLGRKDCDIVVERLDGTSAHLEVFSIMPDRKQPQPGEVIVNEIKTHKQETLASIRQKLLRKINKQRQMLKARENYAVIELNDVSIAGDFAILSSLSSGYKIWLDSTTATRVGEGYDWTRSVFDDDATRNLKGIIYFDLGDYESRRFILNPLFGSQSVSPTRVEIAARAYELFEQRYRQHGHDVDDWLQAERELRGEWMHANGEQV